jgi:hypothetical protein
MNRTQMGDAMALLSAAGIWAELGSNNTIWPCGDREVKLSTVGQVREYIAGQQAANLAAAVADAEAVIDRLPEFNRQHAYVYFNQATRRHGFYFAPDDATAEKYAQRCGLAEQSNWLIVAVVPSKVAE